jgi:hypothetical protein
MSFSKRQDFLDMLRQAFSTVKIESLDQGLDKNRDFRVIKNVETTVEMSFSKNQDFLVMLRQAFSTVKIESLDQDFNKNRGFRVIKTVKMSFLKRQDFLNTL